VGFAILFVLWMIGGSGGGDVKFLGALGAWLGAGSIVEVLVVSAVLSLILTLLTLVVQFVRLGPGGAKRRYLDHAPADKNRHSDFLAEQLRQKRMVRRRLVPFGVPVALATWIVLAVQLIHPVGPQAWGLL
jgi:prepilin peptidase CpaA